MKKTHKAVLLSALVLPGLGQITLKRYKTGIAIILTVAFSLYRMMGIAMQQATAIVDKIAAQGGVLDMQVIANAASSATGSADNATFNLYLWIIIACWLISLVDIWLAGRFVVRMER